MNLHFYSAYIDPGTGSMLFTIVIGLAAALVFFLKSAWIKIKFVLSGGKVKTETTEKAPFVIFSDSKRYFNVFHAICDEFERREIPLEYWTMSQDDPVFQAGYKYVKPVFIGSGNEAFAKLNMLNADICLSTTPGLDVLQWKRSKNTKYYVHLFHDVTEATGYRMFGMDFYDAVLLTGEFQGNYIRQMEEMRGIAEKELYVTGSTYMDDMLLKKETLPEIENKEENTDKTILLAPSWGASSILNKYGKDFLDALVQTGYRIVVRPHPQMATSDPELLKSLKEAFPDSNRFSWNSDNDNFNCLNQSDLMITDFSGVMFDYSLIFDRALIYADVNLDLSPYDAAWFKEENWRLRVLPKLGKKLNPEDFSKMKEVIDSVLSDDHYKEGREEVRAICWQHQKEAAVRTVEYLVQKQKEFTQSK